MSLQKHWVLSPTSQYRPIEVEDLIEEIYQWLFVKSKEGAPGVGGSYIVSSDYLVKDESVSYSKRYTNSRYLPSHACTSEGQMLVIRGLARAAQALSATPATKAKYLAAAKSCSSSLKSCFFLGTQPAGVPTWIVTFETPAAGAWFTIGAWTYGANPTTETTTPAQLVAAFIAGVANPAVGSGSIGVNADESWKWTVSAVSGEPTKVRFTPKFPFVTSLNREGSVVPTITDGPAPSKYPMHWLVNAGSAAECPAYGPSTIGIPDFYGVINADMEFALDGSNVWTAAGSAIANFAYAKKVYDGVPNYYSYNASVSGEIGIIEFVDKDWDAWSVTWGTISAAGWTWEDGAGRIHIDGAAGSHKVTYCTFDGTIAHGARMDADPMYRNLVTGEWKTAGDSLHWGIDVADMMQYIDTVTPEFDWLHLKGSLLEGMEYVANQFDTSLYSFKATTAPGRSFVSVHGTGFRVVTTGIPAGVALSFPVNTSESVTYTMSRSLSTGYVEIIAGAKTDAARKIECQNDSVFFVAAGGVTRTLKFNVSSSNSGTVTIVLTNADTSVEYASNPITISATNTEYSVDLASFASAPPTTAFEISKIKVVFNSLNLGTAITVRIGDVYWSAGVSRKTSLFGHGALPFELNGSTSTGEYGTLGPIYSGYQNPVPYSHNNDYTSAINMLSLLSGAQDSYRDTVGVEGPFAPVFSPYEAFTKIFSPSSMNWFSWNGPDPNTHWGSFQYRPFSDIADYWYRTARWGDGSSADLLTARSLAAQISRKFLRWLTSWLDSERDVQGVPNEFHWWTSPRKTYVDSGMIALALKGAIFCKAAMTFSGTADRSTSSDVIAADYCISRLYNDLISLRGHFGTTMEGALVPESYVTWQGFPAGECMDALALLKIHVDNNWI